MVQAESSGYLNRLKDSTVVNIQMISQVVLVIYYIFCAILVTLTVLSYANPDFSFLLGINLLYIIIIAFLLMGSLWLHTLGHDPKKVSLSGLVMATVYQYFVIQNWDLSYYVSYVILNIVFFIQLGLIINLLFNRKLSLLFDYINGTTN